MKKTKFSILKFDKDLKKRVERDVICVLTRALADLDEDIPYYESGGLARKKMEAWREAARVALEKFKATGKIDTMSLGTCTQLRIEETICKGERDQRINEAEEAAFLKDYPE